MTYANLFHYVEQKNFLGKKIHPYYQQAWQKSKAKAWE
jgi:hypothetical protein